jgi:hypothetical protein
MTTPASRPKPGSIAWADLTVRDAEAVRDFYRAVAGWSPKGLDMGGYEDYVMEPADRHEAIAGICHARGVNASLPPAWLIYIVVADLAFSMSQCRQRGGTVVGSPRSAGSLGEFCVIRDPAGVYAALLQPPA